MEHPDSREALFGYRLRFSPETQPIRHTVIDSIVLRNIRDQDAGSGLTIGKLGSVKIGGVQEFALSLEDLRTSITRLRRQELIDEVVVKKKPHWNLSNKGTSFIGDAEKYADTVRLQVATTLFGQHRSRLDEEYFASILAEIFDRLTLTYLDSMFSETPSPITPAVIENAVRKFGEAFPDADKRSMAAAVRRFFGESNPEFDWIKWTYCKNYYCVRALGLGHKADVLSASVFGGSTFYLDTNVVISALDPTSSRHLAVRQVLDGLSRIGSAIRILNITVAELHEWAAHQSKNVETLIPQIPDTLLPRVEGLLARIEHRSRLDKTQPTAKEFISRYTRSGQEIAKDAIAEIVDDGWFDLNRNSPEMAALADGLRVHYDQTALLRKKTVGAAMHDALALSYLAQLPSGRSERAYFVTLDRSLPKYQPITLFDGLQVNRAMDLEAMLMWLGAISEDDDASSRAVASALTGQLLPTAGGFDLQEFRMLAELEMDCSKMPADDVEQCLLFLRREARGLNLASAEDREKMMGMIRRFFSSPDRKYLTELVMLRNDLEAARSEADDERKARRDRERANRELESDLAREKLERKVEKRMIGAGVAMVVMLVTAVLLANKYGAGDNMFQKIGNAWWIFPLCLSLAIALARWLCRGDLWPVAKTWLHSLGNEGG